MSGDQIIDHGRAKPVLSLQQIIDNYVRTGSRWASGVVTFSFATNGPSGFQPLSEEEKAFARLALETIADVVNLSFMEAPDRGAAAGGIRFGADNNAPDYAWGHAHWRPGPGGYIQSADVTLNPDAVAARSWFVGGYNFMLMMHEAVHSLGVDHPGNYNADGREITYATDASFFQDSWQYTVMSYFRAAETGADHLFDATNLIGSAATLLLHDIAGLQAMYGANTSTRSGDTVYGYNSTAGRAAYDFTANIRPVVTIWDGGGDDTLDLSGSSLAVRLDLTPGAFSDALSMTSNISIAYGAMIENARGGSGDDSLTGNSADNHLDGGAGVDTVVYSGLRADYEARRNADGTWAVIDRRPTARDGTDTLVSIEVLRFADGTVLLDEPLAVVATAAASVLRDASSALGVALSSKVRDGVLSEGQAVRAVIEAARDTTCVATLTYQFFTGKIPESGGLDYLVASTAGNERSLNSAYFQSFSMENRYINFAVNLARDGEGKAAFATRYAGLSFMEAGEEAYKTIFGARPAAEVSAVIEGRLDYFSALGGDGLGAKAAMAGWLMAEAVKAEAGGLARANNAWLEDLADGGAPYGIDLLDVAHGYWRPEFVFGG